MNYDCHILVTGARGLVGSAICRNLKSRGFTNVIEATRDDVDFTNQEDTRNYFVKNTPDYVFLAAAKVGGIGANSTSPADFIYDNLMIQTNTIDSAFSVGVKKLLFLGSSCIYPKDNNTPISEDQMMTGPLEPTNQAYSIAKIAGIEMCRAYRKQYGFNAIAVMPTNIYGPNDNFTSSSSHVIPSMIMRFHQAKIENTNVTLWGDGSPKREFLHVDDLAEACYVCMEHYDSDEIINIGCGEDISIEQLAHMIASVVQFDGDIVWDTSKPNGMMRKVLNVDKIKTLGWLPKVSLKDGITKVYEDYVHGI